MTPTGSQTMAQSLLSRLALLLTLLLAIAGRGATTLAGESPESATTETRLEKPGLPAGITDRPLAALLSAAKQGELPAMIELGDRHLAGLEGAPLDYGQAIDWYRRAADKGSGYAMEKIGGMHRDGLSVEKDYAAARLWYDKAAAAGDHGAAASIGWLYFHGLGVEPDQKAAFSWYEKGANAGSAEAMNNLGYLYQEGLGVEKDVASSLQWSRKAAELGNTTALCNLAEAYAYGELGLAKDSHQAFVLWEQAARLGDARGMLFIGNAYLEGSGIAVNERRGVQWVKWAAERGSSTAMYVLSRLYDEGSHGVEQNVKLGFHWLKMSADAGDSEAMVRVGFAFAAGQGVEKDLTAAAGWFQRAADVGDAEGMYYLAVCYLKGTGVERDPMKMFTLMRQSAALGYPPAVRLIEASRAGTAKNPTPEEKPPESNR